MSSSYPRVPCILTLGLLCLCGTSFAQIVTFSQLDFHFDGVTDYLNTDWGQVDLTYTGQDPVTYFNLNVNGTWQVQNAPLFSAEGAGVQQGISFYFDLGIPQGMDVTSLNYSFALTTDILGTMPSGSTAQEVTDGNISLYAGFDGGLMPSLTAATPTVGGEVAGLGHHSHRNFPNQSSGPKRCAPTAVSNSALYLNRVGGMNIDPAKLTPAAMEAATGFVEGEGSPWNWWELKNAYMTANNIPITTKKVTSMAALVAEMDANQDVEIVQSWVCSNGTNLWLTGHVTALVAIELLKDGRYALDVASDENQNDGEAPDELIRYMYDPKTGNFNEHGIISKFEYAIVECPEPSTLGLAFLGLMRYRRCRK